MIGLRISTELGMGRARVVGDILRCRGLAHPISADDIDHELERLRVAFDSTRAEIQESARRVEEQFNAYLADIFRAHEMVLESLFASDEFAQELRGSLMSAEAAVRRVFRRWRGAFESVKNETLQQRADDVVDIGRKLLRHLEGDDAQTLKNLAAGTVLVVQRLLPSDVVYHNDRAHLSLGKDPPFERAVCPPSSRTARVTSLPRVGGLHHRFEWPEAA